MAPSITSEKRIIDHIITVIAQLKIFFCLIEIEVDLNSRNALASVGIKIQKISSIGIYNF